MVSRVVLPRSSYSAAQLPRPSLSLLLVSTKNMTSKSITSSNYPDSPTRQAFASGAGAISTGHPNRPLITTPFPTEHGSRRASTGRAISRCRLLRICASSNQRRAISAGRCPTSLQRRAVCAQIGPLSGRVIRAVAYRRVASRLVKRREGSALGISMGLIWLCIGDERPSCPRALLFFFL